MYQTTKKYVRRAWLASVVMLNLLLLAACGTQTTPSSLGAASPSVDQGNTSASSSNSQTPTFAPLVNASASVSGLQIDASNVGCGTYLVLADLSRSVYDAATADQISQYALNFYNSTELFGTPSQDDPSIPAALRLLPGGQMCGGSLSLTNTSQQAITISQVTFTVTSKPSQNTLQYPLIDACSSANSSLCNPGANGHGECVYIAQAHFTGNERQAQRVSGSLTTDGTDSAGDPPCDSNLTLNPGDTNTIQIDAVSDAPIIYTIQLGLMAQIGTSAPQSISLPETFQTQFVFVSQEQFTCYSLANGHASQETPVFDDRLLPPFNPNGPSGPACI